MKLFKTKKDTALRGSEKAVIMSTSGFTGNTGPWNDAIDLEMERHAELPEQECKLVQPVWKTVWQYLLGLNIHIHCNLAIPFLGIFQRETHSFVH